LKAWKTSCSIGPPRKTETTVPTPTSPPRSHPLKPAINSSPSLQYPEGKWGFLERCTINVSLGPPAHLIHGSSDGRFSITYAVRDISRKEIESVGYKSASFDELSKKYDPSKLSYGYNTVDDEEIYFIPNPALGLWINHEHFMEI
jgi:hypothetical protein